MPPGRIERPHAGKERVLFRLTMRQSSLGLVAEGHPQGATVAIPPRVDRQVEEEACRQSPRRSITRSLWLTASLDLFLSQSDISAVGHDGRLRPRGFDRLFVSRSHRP